MTSIPRDTLLKLAQLSSIQLADDEIDGLRGDIENILGYVEQLNQLDTDDIQPTYQVVELENIMYQDTTAPAAVSREDLLSLAPDTDKNQIKVPKVL